MIKSTDEATRIAEKLSKPPYGSGRIQDACGTAVLAEREPKTDIISRTLEGTEANRHRSGENVDREKTGDGAGALTQIPRKLLQRHLAENGKNIPDDQLGRLGLGMFFLPQDSQKARKVQDIVDLAISEYGFDFKGWRDVPVEEKVLGTQAKKTLPKISQVIFAKPEGMEEAEFRQRVYDCRWAIKNALSDLPKSESVEQDDYVASFSADTVTYKGLLRADQLREFYKDFQDPDFATSYVLTHVRFATNTISLWRSAHPYHGLMHNGEINTIKKNEEMWLTRMAETGYPNFTFPKGLSDSGRLDAALQHLVHHGFSPEEALLTLTPPAWQHDETMPDNVRAMFKYKSLIQEPWDGPAGLIFAHEDKVVAHLGRGALRPLRYVIYRDAEGRKNIYLGSEDGLVDFHPKDIIKHGRVKAGEIISFNTRTGELKLNNEIVKEIAEYQPRRQDQQPDINYHNRLKRRVLRVPYSGMASYNRGEPKILGENEGIPPIDRGAIVDKKGDKEYSIQLMGYNPDRESPEEFEARTKQLLYSLSMIFADEEVIIDDNSPFVDGKINLTVEKEGALTRALEDSIEKKASFLSKRLDAAVASKSSTLCNERKDLDLIDRQKAYGWHAESLTHFIHPTVLGGKDAIGAMGDDASPAVISKHKLDISNYFKQRFAQVTNPPIDSIRERENMSLRTALGKKSSSYKYLERSKELLEGLEGVYKDYVKGDVSRKNLDDAISRNAIFLSGVLGLKSPKFTGVSQAEFKKTACSTLLTELQHPGRFSRLIHQIETGLAEESKQVVLKSPILRPGQLANIEQHEGVSSHRINMTYEANGDLERALRAICLAAEDAVRKGASTIILSDKDIGKGKAAIPAVVAIAAVDRHLSKEGLRLKSSIVAETGQVTNSHQLALLLGYGASAVDPFMVYEEVSNLMAPENRDARVSTFMKLLTGKYGKDRKAKAEEKADSCTLDEILNNTFNSFEAGLLKVMGKMGVCDIESYIGGILFEEIVLDLDPERQPYLAEIFEGTFSPLGGHGLAELAENYESFLEKAETTKELKDKRSDKKVLEQLGLFYQYPSKDGEEDKVEHGYSADVVKGFTALNKSENKARAIVALREKLRAEPVGWIQIHDDGTALINLQKLNELKLSKLASAGVEEDGYLKIDLKIKEVTDKNIGKIEEALQGTQKHQHTVAQDKSIPKEKTPEEIEGHILSPNYKEFSESIEQAKAGKPTNINDLFKLIFDKTSIDLSEVEPALDILRKVITTGAMSHGALIAEAHEAIAIAMNNLGARSNSGEGSENPKRFGTSSNSAIKQIASGRFGFDAEFLANCGEVEIKISQGAKPGEGGQLPAEKVSVEIAALRNAIPGIDLISPPPHHDIYSIEDLQQLIYTLKCAGVRVGVKLVASEGIDTVAVGVAKALLDGGLDGDELAGCINVAGGSGGTGAASRTSIKHAGMPAVLRLRMVDRALRESGLRDFVSLRTSGGMKTGWDVVKATIMGADEVEFGTTAMMLLDCIMKRECNKLCPRGITTKHKTFIGDIENIEQYFLNMAHEIREILSQLGFKSLDDIRGRTDLLEYVKPEYLRGELDLDIITHQTDNKVIGPEVVEGLKKASDPRKDDVVLAHINEWLEDPEKIEEVDKDGIKVTIDKERKLTDADGKKHDRIVVEAGKLGNCDRSVGARIATTVATKLKRKETDRGEDKRAVPEDAVTIEFIGVAGQDFGALNSHGVHLALKSDPKNETVVSAQDGVGKVMSGGVISVSAPKIEDFATQDNVIAGNACLYGATGGKAFFNGQVGDRFAVKSAGAMAVVEGMGDFGCEYMTSGAVLNLGTYGKGIGSGMSGGFFIQYHATDTEELRQSFRNNCNRGFLDVLSGDDITTYQDNIKEMLQEHLEKTGSEVAKNILANWEQEKSKFSVAVPVGLNMIKSVSEDKDSKIKAVAEAFIEGGRTPTGMMKTFFKSRGVNPDTLLVANRDLGGEGGRKLPMVGR